MIKNAAEERARDARQILIASELTTLGIAGVLLLSAALPTTDEPSSSGLIATSLLLFVFAVLWYHLAPQRFLGDRRFVVGTVIAQMIGWFLLLATGGVTSRYFVYFLVPLIASCFAFSGSATATVASAAIVSYVALAVFDPRFVQAAEARDVAIVRFFGLTAIAVVATLITRLMQRTRDALRARTAELSEQNQELEAARSIALRLSRLRERDEIVRTVYDAAQRTIKAERVIMFIDPETEFTDGWTIASDGVIERFTVVADLPDPARLRPVREMRTIVITDTTRDPGVSQKAREQYGVISQIVVPLVYRGGVVGVAAFSSPRPREWTALEIRLAETIAEGCAPAVATFLTLDQLRDERERLARRMRMLEGLADLSDSLALSTEDGVIATTSARNLHHTFDLRGATVLFSDPSLALLEPRGTSGEVSHHPVISSPGSCPAIRSGRIFRVESADSPVVCPHVSFQPGTKGFVCMPFVAAGQTVGAMFLEPAPDSMFLEAALRGAADRIALTVANQRVLETAQRQAVTDGLTGLYNRHFMTEQLRLLHSLATRHGRAYSAIALDVDMLKRVNDTFGHEKGDLVLRALANSLRRALRTSDVPVKTGGDEIVILLPDTELLEAVKVADRVRCAIDEQGKLEPASAVTVSLGVATWRPGREAKDVLEAADSALYEAKRTGRDRISVEPEPAAT